MHEFIRFRGVRLLLLDRQGHRVHQRVVFNKCCWRLWRGNVDAVANHRKPRGRGLPGMARRRIKSS